MSQFIDTLLAYFQSLSYFDIAFLMALESSIFPVPSELVMIPAGVIAKNGGIDPFVATLAGGVGSVIGATLNYYILGVLIGKPFLEKYGKYILITKEKYDKSESLFLKDQNLYTFLGRFIPVVRHLISIPAGIFRMPMIPFLTLTFIGATLWSGILVFLGWTFGNDVIDIVKEYSHIFTLIVIPLIVVYVWWKLWKK